MNLLDKIKNYLVDTSVVIVVEFFSILMFIIGGNHFIEDTLSSRFGIEMAENVFNIHPASYELTYWTMSLTFSVLSVICIYLYIVDTQKFRLAKVTGIVATIVDCAFDWYYRSGIHEVIIGSVPLESLDPWILVGRFIASFAITIVYFTLASEIFLSLGFGLMTSLFAPAVVQVRKLWRENREAFRRSTSSSSGPIQRFRPPEQPHIPGANRPAPSYRSLTMGDTTQTAKKDRLDF